MLSWRALRGFPRLEKLCNGIPAVLILCIDWSADLRQPEQDHARMRMQIAVSGVSAFRRASRTVQPHFGRRSRRCCITCSMRDGKRRPRARRRLAAHDQTTVLRITDLSRQERHELNETRPPVPNNVCLRRRSSSSRCHW